MTLTKIIQKIKGCAYKVTSHEDEILGGIFRKNENKMLDYLQMRYKDHIVGFANFNNQASFCLDNHVVMTGEKFFSLFNENDYNKNKVILSNQLDIAKCNLDREYSEKHTRSNQ